MAFNLLEDRKINVLIGATLIFFALTLVDKFTKLAIVFGIVWVLNWYLVDNFGSPFKGSGKSGNTLLQIGYGFATFGIFILFSNLLKSFFDENSFPYFQVILFALASCVLVLMTGEGEGAIYFHMITNITAILASYGVLTLNSAIASAVNPFTALTIGAAFNQPFTAETFAALGLGNFISLLLVIIAWGIVIPYLETILLFVTGLGLALKKYAEGTGTKLNDVRAWAVMTVVSFVFLFYHIFSKTKA